MQSPFPGMDPYLEGDLWSDVHHELASQIRRQLLPLIRPKYVALIEHYVVEDNMPASELGIMYPDVELLLQKSELKELPRFANPTEVNVLSPVSFTIPAVLPIEVRIPIVEIRDVKGKQLVTAIEILSPVNKRLPGLSAFLKKRQKMQKAGVHFLEIDLLRRGTRSIQHAKLKDVSYLVALSRAPYQHIDVWAMKLDSILPTIPVPLLPPDQDVVLDLQKAIQAIYQDAAYYLSIDYNAAPPPPTLSKKEKVWIRKLKNK